MNKRIVILINTLDGGGAERVVSTLLNTFVERYECYLILMENKISYDLDDRIKIIDLGEDPSQSGLSKFLRLPLIAYKLSKVIKKYKFSKVVSFLYRANYVNILAKNISNHEVIISERIAPSSMYADNSFSSKISRFLIRALYNKSDLIIPVSKAIQKDLIENFNIKKDQKVIYNPYDIENITKRSKEDIDIEIIKEKSIVTVGSLNSRKNHAMLISAFSKIDDKDFKLYILGKGEEEQRLKNLVESLGIKNRVVFLGFDNNPYKYLSRCSIFILSSNSEGFPNVVAEALICGCGLISTDCLSGPREILAPKTDIDLELKDEIEIARYGILTPVKNSDKLTESINIMIKDKELLGGYSKKAKIRGNDFNLEKIIKQYEELICAE